MPQQDTINKQNMRIQNLESDVQQMAQQQEAIKTVVDVTKAEVEDIDIANTASETTNEALAAIDNAMSIHLVSYLKQESIYPGWQKFIKELPEPIKSKQARIKKITIDGDQYYRLLLGPYQTNADANEACQVVKLTFDFCESLPFEGEILH